MALPNAADMTKWSGSKFTNNDWDGNVDALINFLTNGNYDLNIGKLECTDITANSINLTLASIVPTGSFQWWLGTYSPTGWIEADGANIAIATYPDLFEVFGHTYGLGDGAEVTADGISTVGNVCTVTKTAHGLSDGDTISVKFTVTLSSKVINRGVTISNVTTNTFDFSTIGFIETPEAPLNYVVGTTYPLPDTRGYALRGVDTTSTIDPDAGTRTNRGDGSTGAQVGTKQEDQFKNHRHSRGDSGGSGGGSQSYGNAFGSWWTAYAGGNQTNIVNIAGTGIIKT